ncbi:MAG: lyase family protein [Thermoleophilia bacterium]
MTGGYLGEGGRLTGGPAPELVASGYAQEIAHAPRLARAMGEADLAHAVALADCGALDTAVAAALIGGLRELEAIPADDFPWNPARGDAFNSREAELTRRVGPAAAGWLSAGRPRREAFRVALRQVARDGAVDLHDALVELAEALLVHAAVTAQDLAADYTYLQPAQPTTVGHLLLAYLRPALRDAARLREVHGELCRSVAGVGGSAGSRWPIDRTRLAALLGCDGLVEHAKDAAWQVDVYVQLVAAVATSCMHGSHIGQDLEILASQEFGMVQLADQHSRASALMPQKRNPYALAVVRTMAGTAAGELAGLLVTLHTGSARTDHFHALNGMVPRLMAEAHAVAHLLARVVAGMHVDSARMGDAARRGFTQAADVADVVAQDCGLDYRTAHHVVGRAVRMVVDAGGEPGDLTPDLLERAGADAGGHAVRISPERLAEALDPLACALGRPQVGSSGPEAMRAMIAHAGADIAEARVWSREARRRREAGAHLLAASADALVSRGSTST